MNIAARRRGVGLTLLGLLIEARAAAAGTHRVRSPGGNLQLTVSHDPAAGTLTYDLHSGSTPLIEKGALGLTTSRGDFTGGLSFRRQARRPIRDSYQLPAGKRSTYLDHGSELELVLRRETQEVRLLLRAYDDGIAFRYLLPGRGAVEISGEATTFPLASQELRIWGQAHPNDYGYESALGPVTAERVSMPVLAQLPERNHFLLIAQAASYGTYIIPNYKRQGSVLSLSFPMDQREPVKTTLPFASPWRVVMVSPQNPGRIVESTLLESLNPPTEPALRRAAWIQPGRASWDFIAGEGQDLRAWIDFDAEMGWEYHFADAGWERRVPNMAEVAAYGKSRKVGIVVWGKVANKSTLNTPERIEAFMKNLAQLGVRGAKVDFFDQRDGTAEKTDDLEDTQARLIVRDQLSESAARHQLLLEFHGCAVPSGERRRWPHLMSAEAVYGLERRKQNLTHNLTIPFVRNIMGPVSYTPFHLTRSAGSLGHQLGQILLYEAGIQIFAEHHDKIRSFTAVDFLKAVPAAWDEIRFVDGHPGSHAIFARRKGSSWFLGGITGEARTARIPLPFLNKGASYQATVYRDGDSKTALVKDQKALASSDILEIPMIAAGGFAAVLRPDSSAKTAR